LNEVLRKTIWISGIQVLIVTVNFAANIVLARSMDLADFGSYHALIAWAAAGASFGLPGMNVAITRGCLKKYDRFYWWAQKKALISSVGGGLLVSIGGLVLFLVEGEFTAKCGFLLLVAASIPLGGFQGIDSALIGKGEYRLSRFLALIGAVLTFVFTASIALTIKQTEWVFMGFLSAKCLTILIGFYWVRKKLSEAPPDPELEDSLMRQGWRQVGVGVFTLITSQIDRIILSIISPVVLAVYHIAILLPQRAVGSSKVLLGVICADWGKLTGEENLRRINKKIHVMLFGGVMGAGIIALLLTWIIPMVFGEGYRESVILGQLFCLNIIFSIPMAFYLGYEQFQHDGEFSQKIEVKRALFFLPLAAVLALTLGGLGLVIVHIIVNTITAFLCFKQFNRRCNAAGIV
tara:strand:+ start:1412 stop:2629 length:1218 start_codon:yes stop_codon:yes gene_type:complete